MNKTYLAEKAVKLAQELSAKSTNLFAICFNVTEENEFGFIQTDISGRCIYDAKYSSYLDWVLAVHSKYSAKTRFIEWNVLPIEFLGVDETSLRNETEQLLDSNFMGQ